MILIPLGDPLSVNIEVIASFILEDKISPQLLKEHNYQIVLIGDYSQWLWQTKELFGESLCLPEYENNLTEYENTKSKKELISFLSISNYEKDTRTLTKLERGTIAKKSLDAVASFISHKKLKVLTCPIDKSACYLAGFEFSGQTEFFENLYNTKSVMILAAKKIRVGLITNHLPIAQVSSSLSIELIIEKTKTFSKALSKIINKENPKIAICGLNPHCGEYGKIGTEELTIIKPAIKILRKELDIIGPVSADTIFWLSKEKIPLDGILAIYHDQGLAPIKALYFEETINITGGLPILRVSPDHGPAQDLFLQKKASTKSFWHCFQQMGF